MASLFWYIIAFVSIRTESKPGVIIFLSTFWVQPAFVVFKVVNNILDPPQTPLNMILVYLLSGVFIIGRLVTIGCVWRCMHSFGKGLALIFKKEEEEKKPLLDKLIDKQII